MVDKKDIEQLIVDKMVDILKKDLQHFSPNDTQMIKELTGALVEITDCYGLRDNTQSTPNFNITESIKQLDSK